MSYLGRKGSPAPLVSSDIPDNSITGAKLEDNPTIAGNLTVSGDLVPSTPLSHRNMIINGDMRVAQRSASSTVAGYSTVDRFLTNAYNVGTPTQAQVAITDLDRFSTAYRHTSPSHTTSNASYYIIIHKIEAQNLQCARTSGGAAGTKPMVLSFYVKTSWADTFYTVIDAEDGTIRRLSFSYTTVADEWKRVTHVLPADTVAQFDNNNGTGLVIYWWLMSGSNYTGGTGVGAGAWNNYTNANQNCVDDPSFLGASGRTWEITGVQLELGSSATPFEHRSYGDELARCQRYLQHHQAQTAWAPFGNGQAIGTTSVEVFIPFIKTMRAQPTITEYLAGCSDGANTVLDVTGTGAIYWTTQGTNITFTVSGATQYRSYSVLSNASSDGYLRLDAEL